MLKKQYIKLMSDFKKFFLFTVNLGKATEPRPMPTGQVQKNGYTYFLMPNSQSKEITASELTEAFKNAQEKSEKQGSLSKPAG